MVCFGEHQPSALDIKIFAVQTGKITTGNSHSSNRALSLCFLPIFAGQMQQRVLLLLCFLSSFASALQAQNPDVRGVVYDSESGVPIQGVQVSLKGTNYIALTDAEGFFNFAAVSVGDYSLILVQDDYEEFTESITVIAGKNFKKNFYLKRKVVELKNITITARNVRKQREVLIGNTSIDRRDIARMPSVGGEPDLLQYLQVLPGVVFSGDQGGQLYIRGGSPVMNKVMLDGMTIYNPFHSIGLFSVFETDMIRSTEVYSAGFNAEYGGRISAIVDVRTRDGDKTRHRGKLALNPFTSKALLEGPLKKFKQGAGSSSYAISYRNSFLRQSSQLFYKYADPDKLPYTFGDLHAKMSFTGASGSYLKLFGFRLGDRVAFPGTTEYNWRSNGFGAKFLLVPDESKMRIDGFFSYSDYLIRQLESDQKPRSSGINGFNVGLNFTYPSGKNEFRYGAEINGFRTEFQIYNPNNRLITQFENTTEITGYGMYRWVKNRWVIQPGIRGLFYASLGNSSIEPRLSAKYSFSKRFSLKFAGGFYSQNLMSAVSDRDVVNLFYGFLSGPENLPATFNGNPVTHKLQKARHLVTGLEWDPAPAHNVIVEAYVKDFTQITNINRDKLFDDNDKNRDKPSRLKQDYLIETGMASGVDFRYKYERKKWYVWAVYSLTYVTRFDGINTYAPVFDRRHNINFLTSYNLDPAGNAMISVRWNYGSGFPFTQTQGFYEKLDFRQGISSDYTKTNGSLGIYYAGLNQGRLPSYHRLDVNFQKKWKLENKRELQFTATCTNAYNRANVFYFDRAKFQRVDQLPILPAAGLSYSF
ncbi:MAG: hypothetical protein RLZZ370_1029 [Bacteroidota bacterium]